MRILVTGARQGLGLAVAQRLASDGHDLMLADIAEDLAEVTEPLVAASRGTILTQHADVSVAEDVDRTVESAVSALGGLDGAVHIAGIGGPNLTVADYDEASFRQVIDVNLVGTFLVGRAVARALLAGGSGGSIVLTSSIFGQTGVPTGGAYGASKAGVVLLMQSMALELAPAGIRVNAIAPGNMATRMHFDEIAFQAQLSGVSFDAKREEIRQSIPLGRHGTGGDIAGAAAFLLGDDASYITGQTLGVNGGVHLC